MKKFYTILLALIIPCTIRLELNAQSLEVSGTLFIPQDSIGFTYESPDFDTADWIGIYHIDDIPGENADPSVIYEYIPTGTGTIYIQAPGETGRYKAFLFCCDVWDTIAVSAEFDVVVPVLTASQSSYVQGDSIVFSYVSPKFSETDWIGIYPAGTKPGDDNPAIDWDYIPDSAGIMVFKTELDPGIYDAYLLCCDGYDSIAAFTFEVIDVNFAFVHPTNLVFAAGSPIEFTFNDPEYIEGDWIGVYFEGDDPELVSTLAWDSVHSITGSISFAGTLAGGTYFAALFCCGGNETEYARSDIFTIQAGAVGTYVKTSASVYPVDSRIIVNYRDKDWVDTDWIAIYPKGITPSGSPEATLWEYAASDSGTIEFGESLPADDWVAYLLCCDGYNIKAKYDFTVSDESASVVASDISYAPTDSLVFTYHSPNWTDTDWIGIYNAGDEPGPIPSITWFYIPESSGTLVFRYPDNHSLAPGEYWAALLCCDGYDVLAQTTFFITEDIIDALIPVKDSDRLIVYPNPTNGRITIQSFEGDWLKDIKVYNVTGSLLHHEKALSNNIAKTLDLSSFRKGIYFLEIATVNTVRSVKLVIQ